MKKLLIIISAILLIVCVYLGLRMSQEQRAKNDYEQALKEEQAVIKKWKDRAGKWRAEKIAANVSKKKLQEMLDSVKNIPPKVHSYSEVSTRTKDSINMKIHYDTIPVFDTVGTYDTTINVKDNIYIGRFQYNDKWIDLNGAVYNGRIWTRYTVRDSIQLTTNWKSQGLFKPDQLYITGISHNPNTQITGLRNYSAREPPRDNWAVVLGPSVGVTPNLTWFPISITFGYKIASF